MTHGTQRNLLREPVFSVRDRRETDRVDLPEVLRRLTTGDELAFPGLRPHQAHPWHAFLVQLGALVAARSGDEKMPTSAEAWREGLLDLAGDAGEGAWDLVAEDTAKPAFMQVPVPEGQWARYKPAAEAPDDLDMLVTAKNHDVKNHLMAAARPEHWVYALVTLQTFQGFSGRGNYGVARMNSGFGSRPGLAATPSLGWSERFRRDVKVWLETREELLGPGYEYAEDDGHALLWTLPWDGEKPRVGLGECDPFFIEVCRRVRLVAAGDRLVAHTAPSRKAFLDAKERQGDTGDIWTPVKATSDGTTALTVSPKGLTYRLLQDVLFGSDWARQPALRVCREDGDHPVLIAQVMARGQGKTEGYHERRIPVPKKGVGFVRDDKKRAKLGDFAKARVARVDEVRRSILRPALCALLQGALEALDLRDDRADRWLERFDRAVDGVFFEDLWRDVSLEDGDERDAPWDQRLYRLARLQLDDAIRSAPVPKARDYRAVATAEMIFEGAARNKLELQAPTTPSEEGSTDE